MFNEVGTKVFMIEEGEWSGKTLATVGEDFIVTNFQLLESQDFRLEDFFSITVGTESSSLGSTFTVSLNEDELGRLIYSCPNL